MPPQDKPVVIGVDGALRTRPAIRAGAAEAVALDVPVHLVHVVPDRLPLVAVDSKSRNELVERGKRLLAAAVLDLSVAAPAARPTTEVRHGGVATELAAASEGAEALFVGRANRPLADQLRRGNAGAGVVSRARCPVVSVPETWTEETPRGPVVVALKSTAAADELFAEGFAAAARDGLPLVALHAWKLPGVYDDIIVSRIGPDEATQRATAGIEVLLRDWRMRYPDVPVEVRTVHDPPVHALVVASQTAHQLVLVRRTFGIGPGVLGGTGRIVLRHAECPVRVVPPLERAAAGEAALPA